MCYRSGTGIYAAAYAQAWTYACVYSSGGVTFLREMTPCWNYNIKSKIRLRQSVCINMKNIPTNFIPIRFETAAP